MKENRFSRFIHTAGPALAESFEKYRILKKRTEITSELMEVTAEPLMAEVEEPKAEETINESA